MFINANEIINLIQACKDVKERLPVDDHMIHVDDIAKTLQNLIDDEASRLGDSWVGMDPLPEIKFPPRRREQDRRADRLNQSLKTTKGNA